MVLWSVLLRYSFRAGKRRSDPDRFSAVLTGFLMPVFGDTRTPSDEQNSLQGIVVRKLNKTHSNPHYSSG